jgi:lipopolysaccharide transport system permease protein
MNEGFFGEIWRFRELLYFFAWRDIKVRYRQAALGVAWAVFQPLITMLVFTIFFGSLAKMPSDGIPYPIFSYCGLVPWTYFSGVLGLAGNSLISNSNLITKVYFPRILLPASVAVAGLLDFLMGAAFLVILMFYYHVRPGWSLLMAPVWIAVMLMVTIGVSMWVSAVNVKYRDVKYVLPFAIQILLFSTPVIYPVTIVPERYRFLLALNPCWGMVDGLRSAIFPGRATDFVLLGTSVAVAALTFVGGAYYFRKTERSFADVI